MGKSNAVTIPIVTNPFKPNSKPAIYWDLMNTRYNYDSNTGHCDPVPRSVFELHGLGLGNGGDWCRSDGTLGRYYNIHREKVDGAIASVALHGYRKNHFNNKISKAVRDALAREPCVVLATTSDIQIDHKDGYKDDYGLPDKQRVADFQPMHRNVNTAKRQHCKTCKSTGKRFDATRLGFPYAVTRGVQKYTGSCAGCYWYDPPAFIKETTKKQLQSVTQTQQN